MKEIKGDYKGISLASIVIEVIRDWELASNLGYMVMDNAPNNTIMITALSLGK